MSILHLSALLLTSSILGLHSARLAPQMHIQALAHDSVQGDDDGPPLDGCRTNLWYDTCCCFVDAGILKQDQCICMENAWNCEKKLRLRYSMKPSRQIPSQSSVERKWFELEKGGYVSGFQAVADGYCNAAPVKHPQVDPLERSYDCTCSTAMGHSVEMACGSSCSVRDCQRSKPDIFDWTPLVSGRGRCCRSSYGSQVEGCPQVLAPITESHVITIVTDALDHAATGDKKAFLVKTSEHLIEDMTNSFASAKEKKMSASRSGAQFFFSGDYGYILKSINPSEYKVLAKIANKPLIDHLDSFRIDDISLQQGGHCTDMYIVHNNPAIHRDFKDTPEWQLARKIQELATSNGEAFFGYWNYLAKYSLLAGTTIYGHEKSRYVAYWCPLAAEWRLQIAAKIVDFSECEDRFNDPLYRWLHGHTSRENTEEHVLTVYNSFINSFPLTTEVARSIDIVNSRCTEYWQPGSLINEFLLAFEYKDFPWMVLKNTVTAVKRELYRHGFREHQSNDVFDVKPFPIHSDQRPMLFKMQFAKDGMWGWRNWGSVKRNLEKDLIFMDNALDNEMVDYSMLVSTFYIDDNRMVLDHVPFPNCVERKLREIRTFTAGRKGASDYGDAPGSILVCFSIIDMLMEFTLQKTPENLLLFNKWSSWSEKIMTMFYCLGHPGTDSKCSKYEALRDEYAGVDIPSIDSAGVKDISNVFTAENEVVIKDPDTGVTSTWKCCCRSGKCMLADTSKQKKWYPGKKLVDLAAGVALNSKGCGSLVGSGWHSYWRDPKKCVLPAEDARKVYRNVVLSEADGWV